MAIRSVTKESPAAKMREHIRSHRDRAHNLHGELNAASGCVRNLACQRVEAARDVDGDFDRIESCRRGLEIDGSDCAEERLSSVKSERRQRSGWRYIIGT